MSTKEFWRDAWPGLLGAAINYALAAFHYPRPAFVIVHVVLGTICIAAVVSFIALKRLIHEREGRR